MGVGQVKNAVAILMDLWFLIPYSYWLKSYSSFGFSLLASSDFCLPELTSSFTNIPDSHPNLCSHYTRCNLYWSEGCLALDSVGELVIFIFVSNVQHDTWHIVSVKCLWNRCCINKSEIENNHINTGNFKPEDPLNMHSRQLFNSATPIYGGSIVCQAPEATEEKDNTGSMNSKSVCTAKITNNTKQHLISVSLELQECSDGGDRTHWDSEQHGN